jgi:heme-degrading monooxygenase HmoA
LESEGFVRLWSFRPHEMTSVVDERIRDVLVPAAEAAQGLRAFYAGRRGTDETAERVFASVWDSELAVDSAAALLGLEPEFGDGKAEVLPLSIAITAPDHADPPPTIMRIFRGDVRPGEMDTYLEAARRGTLEDIAGETGPLGLYLARVDPGHFVTVSVWRGWDPIMRATGGNLQQPIATRHATLLVGGGAAHYEILPGSVVTRTGAPSRVD